MAVAGELSLDDTARMQEKPKVDRSYPTTQEWELFDGQPDEVTDFGYLFVVAI